MPSVQPSLREEGGGRYAGAIVEKLEVKRQPELSPARVTGSVSRGSTRDVDVTDGAFCHL